MKKAVIDEHLSLVQGTLEQWLTFKKFLLLAFSNEPITSEAEGNFLEIKSAVARNIRTLGERVKDTGGIDYGDKIVRELLNKCVSATSVRSLPDADKRTLYKQWHTAFVRLSRSVGALKFMSEGYVPQSGGKGKKGKKSGGAKSGMGMTITIIAILLLLGGGAVAALFFLGFL
ncbi:MAG: hypothetical protein PWP23_2890 [Candidatus Sumerlaeota bacterium]|nr:hypothetical protein [Candidatus Sumerlaeota bacterium]